MLPCLSKLSLSVLVLLREKRIEAYAKSSFIKQPKIIIIAKSAASKKYKIIIHLLSVSDCLNKLMNLYSSFILSKYDLSINRPFNISYILY